MERLRMLLLFVVLVIATNALFIFCNVSQKISFFAAMTISVAITLLVFNESGEFRFSKKRRAIKKLAKIMAESGVYVPDGYPRTHHHWSFEVDLRNESKRSEMQGLLDYLLGEKARQMANAFIKKEAIRTAIQNTGRNLKKGVGWNSMTRSNIKTELEVLKSRSEKAESAKGLFDELRDLVRNAGFEVWNDFEYYLALKV